MKDSVAYRGLVLWKAVTYNDSVLANDILYRNLRLKLKSLDRQHPYLLVVLEKMILYVLDILLYGGPQVHSEFQLTLLIFKHTPDSKSSLLILKAHS